ncbi:hypothetical protein [Fodinicola acaciae]|uniref:hypothetical protein n=1 Tax=Fodinicola acaciae TaxID=2681555 RepID=UPI0013D0DEFF|nr:hypothetical protein [Fodinicola acaciae]
MADDQIRYAASGGSQRTDVRLAIEPGGTGRLFVGSSMSLPTAGPLDTLGTFEGALDSGVLSRLRSLLAGGAPVVPAEPAIPGSVVRHLATAGWEVMIPGYAPAPLDEVESLLQQAIATLLEHPAEAVRLWIDRDGAFVLTAAGDRPVELGSLATLRGTYVVRDADGAVLAATPVVAPSDTSGRLLGPGESLRLPAAEAASGGLSGGVELDAVIGGRSCRLLLQAAPITR